MRLIRVRHLLLSAALLTVGGLSIPQPSDAAAEVDVAFSGVHSQFFNQFWEARSDLSRRDGHFVHWMPPRGSFYADAFAPVTSIYLTDPDHAVQGMTLTFLTPDGSAAAPPYEGDEYDPEVANRRAFYFANNPQEGGYVYVDDFPAGIWSLHFEATDSSGAVVATHDLPVEAVPMEDAVRPRVKTITFRRNPLVVPAKERYPGQVIKLRVYDPDRIGNLAWLKDDTIRKVPKKYRQLCGRNGTSSLWYNTRSRKGSTALYKFSTTACPVIGRHKVNVMLSTPQDDGFEDALGTKFEHFFQGHNVVGNYFVRRP